MNMKFTPEMSKFSDLETSILEKSILLEKEFHDHVVGSQMKKYITHKKFMLSFLTILLSKNSEKLGLTRSNS